jgi:predicted ATP-binding protein involved in virulence
MMKIRKVHLENHPLFGTMDIDFIGIDGKALDTIIIAGANGSGKTTLLTTISEILSNSKNPFLNAYLEMEFCGPGGNPIIESCFNANIKSKQELLPSLLSHTSEREKSRVIYMPTEINFDSLRTKTLSFSSTYSFKTVIDREILHDIPSFLATRINEEVFKDMESPAKYAIQRVCNELNSLFKILDSDVQIVGLNPEGEKFPMFRNSAGKVFDINYLSSGEKQLFVRAMALRMLNANNSVILIDGPEISMHPLWQQRIINVYEHMGNNNQVIAATQSPLVISSVNQENIKLLRKEKGKIKLVNNNEVGGLYLQSSKFFV